MELSNYHKARIRSIGPKLDLGCGAACLSGHVGIDIQDFGQDILWDIRHGIPVPDQSVTHIHTSHFVEHLAEAELCVLWNELMRICRVGATIDLRCPYASDTTARYHSHLSLWNEQRVLGAVAGFATPTQREKYHRWLKVLHLSKAGAELVAKLTMINQ